MTTGAAVEPVAAGISTEIQMLAKKLEEMDVQGLEMKLERLSAEMQAVGEKMEKSFLEHGSIFYSSYIFTY